MARSLGLKIKSTESAKLSHAHVNPKGPTVKRAILRPRRQNEVSVNRKSTHQRLTNKSECSDSGTPGGDSLVKRAADTLREDILRAVPTGRLFLGSELELMSRLGVSRPTFRQAARLLQHEQLLLIKRGVSGGFFARTPSEQVITRMASVLLSTKGTTLRQVNDACGPLITEALASIARNDDPDVRRRVRIFWLEASARKLEFEFDAHTRARLVLEFERLIGELSGNPALMMMLNVMREIIRSQRYNYFDMNLHRTTEYLTFVEKVASAVLDGDVEICRVVCQRFFAKVSDWLPEGDREAIRAFPAN